MDEKRNNDLFSQLLPDALENALGLSGGSTGDPGGSTRDPETQDLALQRILQLTGGAGGPLENALRDFMNGKGDLHAAAEADATTAAAETTRAGGFPLGAVSTGTIESLLVNQFHLSPPIAKILAGLLVNLFPATKKTTRKTPRRPKPKSTAKPKASAKKPRKKTEAKPKKPATGKTTTKKPAAKRPVAKRPVAKTPAAKRKTRAGTIET